MIDANFSSPQLHVDLQALQANYRMLTKLSAPAKCGAAVKANAYGLGMAQCAKALWEAGCTTFFVAMTKEAADLRTLLPDATIYVLNGLALGAEETLHNFNLRPSLVSLAEVEEFNRFCKKLGRKLPAALHIESGINRLGLSAEDVTNLSLRPELTESFEISLIMSHLANADISDDEMNAAQIVEFNRLRALLPNVPASLANSAGTLNGADYHFDLVRPGIALYGGNPFLGHAENPMAPVARLQSPILQIRDVPAGERVGYGGTWRAENNSRIAIVSGGYADGFPRRLSSEPEETHAKVWISGYEAPVIGRVSMDMIKVDVTHIPEQIAQRGEIVELFGPNYSIDELALRAGTIPYEILTGIGGRVARHYSGIE
ncbi:MAG: alanine racemase [Hyphomicrobiales bacterium]